MDRGEIGAKIIEIGLEVQRAFAMHKAGDPDGAARLLYDIARDIGWTRERLLDEHFAKQRAIQTPLTRDPP